MRSQDLDKEELNLSNACGTYSRKAAVLLYQMLEMGLFDGVAWVDAFYVYQSVFILALDFLARPWDEQDNTEDMARKKAVRDVMGALHSVKLCPTYTILTQVSLQLAKIVGIFDLRSDQHEKSEEFRRYMEQQQATFTFDQSVAPAGNVVQNWFQKEPIDLPWDLKDFFGADSYIGPVTMAPTQQYTSMSMDTPYNPLIPPIMTEAEMTPIPPHTAYTHWGSIDTPFAPRNMGGNVPRGPGMGQ